MHVNYKHPAVLRVKLSGYGCQYCNFRYIYRQCRNKEVLRAMQHLGPQFLGARSLWEMEKMYALCATKTCKI